MFSKQIVFKRISNDASWKTFIVKSAIFYVLCAVDMLIDSLVACIWPFVWLRT